MMGCGALQWAVGCYGGVWGTAWGVGLGLVVGEGRSVAMVCEAAMWGRKRA